MVYITKQKLDNIHNVSFNLLIELTFVLFIFFTAGIRKIILIRGSMSNMMNN